MTMTTSSFDVRTVNLRAVNSLTKYPSIPTYHALDPKNGSLLDDVVRFPGEVIATEKVDGTNSRIIFLPDGSYLLGSREELLYAQGDLIGNPALGIVEALKPLAEGLPRGKADFIRVFYLELYGGKIGGNAKQYSTKGAVGWRLFDIATVDGLGDKLSWPSERISSWRDAGGQTFADEDELTEASRLSGLELTPRLFSDKDGASLPGDVENTLDLLRFYLPETLVGLDAAGRSEGIVFRSHDRSVIAKARFQDYERTLKRRARS